MKSALTLAAIVLVCVVVWTLYPKDDKSVEDLDEPQTTATQIKETKIIRQHSGELMAQKIQLAGLQRDVESLKDQGVDRPVDLPPQALNIEEMKALSRAANKKRVDNLNRLLEQEPIDNAWAATTEEQARSWAENEPRAELKSIACRSKFCRAEIVPGDDVERESLFDEVTMKPPFNTNGFVHTPPDSKKGDSTLIYFTKEGYSMVDIEGDGTQQESH